MNYLTKLISSLQKRDLTLIQFEDILSKYETFYDSFEQQLELLISNGFPISISDTNISLKTKNTRLNDQVFCIVDIEVNYPNTSRGQIIELGAIRYKNGQIIEKYSSLVNAYDIPQKIQDITSITPSMLQTAPSLQTVLEEFKIFVEDDKIIAHNLNFDYEYLSDSLEQYIFGRLANRALCTIDLSQRLFDNDRYGLKALSEFFKFNNDNHHRAYDDAYLTMQIFQKCLDKLPRDIKSSEDLIKFSQS